MAETSRAAAEAFFHTTMPGLVGGLTVYVGDRALAEDLAQEAMLRAFRRWERVAALDVPEAWVWRVAVNLAKSDLRRQRVARRVRRRLEASAGSTVTSEERDWAAVAVQEAVATLPERQRLAVVLRYYLDLSVADTAARMEVTEDAVRSLTKRGVAALRTTFRTNALPEEATDG